MTTPPDFEARAREILHWFDASPAEDEPKLQAAISTALTQAYEEGRQQGLQDALPVHQRKPPPIDFSEDV